MKHRDILVLVASWPEDLRSDWEETAAHIEFDAGFSREQAERKAFEMLRAKAVARLSQP